MSMHLRAKDQASRGWTQRMWYHWKSSSAPLSKPRVQCTRKGLTNKLRGAKDVLKLIPSFNLVGNAKVNEFDPRVGHILVQEHDVFRLRQERKSRVVGGRCTASASLGLQEQHPEFPWASPTPSPRGISRLISPCRSRAEPVHLLNPWAFCAH